MLVLVLGNSAYLAVRLMEQNNCRRKGLSFGAELSQIEHEQEHEHDSPNFGINAKRGSSTGVPPVFCLTRGTPVLQLTGGTPVLQ